MGARLDDCPVEVKTLWGALGQRRTVADSVTVWIYIAMNRSEVI